MAINQNPYVTYVPPSQRSVLGSSYVSPERDYAFAVPNVGNPNLVYNQPGAARAGAERVPPMSGPLPPAQRTMSTGGYLPPNRVMPPPTGGNLPPNQVPRPPPTGGPGQQLPLPSPPPTGGPGQPLPAAAANPQWMMQFGPPAQYSAPRNVNYGGSLLDQILYRLNIGMGQGGQLPGAN